MKMPWSSPSANCMALPATSFRPKVAIATSPDRLRMARTSHRKSAKLEKLSSTTGICSRGASLKVPHICSFAMVLSKSRTRSLHGGEGSRLSSRAADESSFSAADSAATSCSRSAFASDTVSGWASAARAGTKACRIERELFKAMAAWSIFSAVWAVTAGFAPALAPGLGVGVPRALAVLVAPALAFAGSCLFCSRCNGDTGLADLA
mmetsp:Transcript_5034/g.11901  ORF Transcript_5034/g.11901 Transcript_5034/m.11901 type:complete len:207 (+) Transcript_5034:98-718(+)